MNTLLESLQEAPSHGATGTGLVSKASYENPGISVHLVYIP